MRNNLISLMACFVVLLKVAVAQQGDPPPAAQPDKPAEPPAVAAAAVEPPKAAEPAAAVEAPKAAEPPVVAAEPPKAVEPPKAAEAPKAAQPPAGNVLDELLGAVQPPAVAASNAPPPVAVAPAELPKAVAVEGEKAAPPPAKIDVEGVVGEAPKAAAAKSPEVADIENLQKTIREAMWAHAKHQIVRAETEFNNGKFQDAIRFYQEAQNALDQAGDREGSEELKKRVYKGMGDTHYNWARLLMKERSFEDAKKNARAAGAYWHPKSQELMGEIEKAENKTPEPVVTYPPARWKQKDYIAKERDIVARMRMGKEHFLTGEYEKSRELYETVMREDPENTEAIRMLHKIAEIKERVAIMEREMTRQGMVADTRKAWARRDYTDLGELSEMRTNTVGGVRPPPDEVIRQHILTKMEKIVLPEIDFKQAHIRDVIDFLGKQSQECDKDEADQAKKGVNIVLSLSPAGGAKQEAAPPAGADPFAPAPPAGEKAGGGGGGAEDSFLITFSARHISLREALKIVCEVANLKYRVEGSIVMVLPLNAPDGRIILRMYDVLPSFLQRVADVGQGLALAGPNNAGPNALAPPAPPAAGAGQGLDLKATFTGFGIAWPQGSSIQHLPQIGKLIVANTVDNLATFEKILGVLNVVPAQIEIEARFVEVRQTDVESLGFEWLLTDAWEVMQRRGSESLPLNQRQRIQIDPSGTPQSSTGGGGLTGGNRFLVSGANLPPSVGAVNDGILRVSSVLTNPELSMILHAIQQKGNADLLSAPKVTTKSAAEATIKVVREYIYPTEFTVTPIMGAAAGGVNTVVGGVVEPGGFETREVGVILSVMPEVTSDGQMIDLTMTPQVVDEPDWENYGSEYTDPEGRVMRLPMRQPIFKARSVSTQLSIYNGSTVVLGGMINEIRNAVDDKIPILGDLPFIGRLFRSQYEHSDKRNLLIFVTARMVDPGGRAITPQSKTLPALIPGMAASSSK